jgi:hypothetical protein
MNYIRTDIGRGNIGGALFELSLGTIATYGIIFMFNLGIESVSKKKK